jgi:DNA repair protein RadC
MSALVSPLPVRGVAPWVRLVRATPAGYSAAGPRERVDTPRAAAAAVDDLRREDVEVLVVLVLDAQHRVIARTEVSRGLVSASLVHAREVFRVAIAMGGSAIILAHNHPSGDCTPSPEDVKVTSQIQEAGRVLDIPLFDHVIVGGVADYCSLCERGVL